MTEAAKKQERMLKTNQGFCQESMQVNKEASRKELMEKVASNWAKTLQQVARKQARRYERRVLINLTQTYV